MDESREFEVWGQRGEKGLGDSGRVSWEGGAYSDCSIGRGLRGTNYSLLVS